MCCWVKINYAASDTFARIFEHGLNNSVTLNLHKSAAPQKFYFQQLGTGNAGATSTTNISGNWQHVSIKYDGLTQYIYVDGNLEDTYARGSFASSSQVWHFGRNSGAASVTRLNGSIADVRYFNRSISDGQIKSIYLNPSAPFQKKTTTVVSVPTAPPTTTAKAVVLKKPKPSYATGYARNASESANPNLWKGLVGAWMPSFGVTGGEVKELTSKSPNLTLQNIPYSNWEVKEKSLAVMLEGNDDYLNGSYCDAVNFGYESFAVTSHFYVTAYSVIEAMFDGRTSSSPYHGFHTYMRNSDRVQVQLRSSGALDQYLFLFTSIGGQLATDKIHSMSTVVDRQKSTCIQYVNGINIGSASISSGMTDINSNTDFRFGRNITNQYPLTGGVASLLIHHRALNEKEVRTLHANPAAPFLRKQQTVGLSTAAVVPSANFNPFSVLTHPLEQ